MALLTMIGMETGDMSELHPNTSGGSASNSHAHTGTYSLRINGSSTIHCQAFGSTGKFALASNGAKWLTFWLWVDTLPVEGASLLAAIGSSSGTNNYTAYLELSTTGMIKIKATGQSDSSEVGPIATGAWHRIDFRAANAGTCGLALNKGTEVTSTGRAATEGMFLFGTGGAGLTIDLFIDDIWFSDSGFAPDDGGVNHIPPTGDSGTNTAWTASAGNKWACVDEIPPSNADYISSGTGAGDQRYSATHASLTTLGIKGAIRGVMPVFRMWEPTSTTTLGAVGIRSGSTNFEKTGVDIGSTTNITMGAMYELDPNTSAAWAGSAVDAAEPLVKRSTSDTSNIRCGFMALMVWAAGSAAGTSSLILPFPVMAAAGALSPEGSGALTIPFPVMTAAGTQQSGASGSGSLILPFPVMTAAGIQEAIGTGSLILPFPVMTAAGIQKLIGSGSLILPFPVMTAAGTHPGMVGSGALVLPFPVMTATGAMPLRGVAALVLPFPVMTAVGGMIPEGVGGLILPFPVMTAAGLHAAEGTGSLILPFPVMSGVGEQTYVGTSSLILPFPVMSGAGQHIDIQGSGALVAPFPVLSAVGFVLPEGNGSLVLPFPIMSASGQRVISVLQAKPPPGVGRTLMVPPSGLGRVNSTQRGVGRYLPPRRGGGR